MYGRLVESYRPENKDPNKTRLAVGGYRVHYTGDCGTPTVALLTVKLQLIIVVSTKGARYTTLEIKDFYLSTPIKRSEYMRVKLINLPKYFIKQFKLATKPPRMVTFI